jgi:uncharacterized protein (DUF1778 family)
MTTAMATPVTHREYEVSTVVPMPEQKSERVNLRVAPSDAALLRSAAEEEGVSLSEFLVESARYRAQMVLADRTRFELDDDAWDEFNAMLERPARVIPELVELFRRARPE